MIKLLVLFLAILLAACTWPASAAAGDGGPRVIEVEVSRWGFNGDPNHLITVEEGELVEFHFTYGDGDMEQSNPHVMMIEGTGLESGLIDQDNPVTTIRFRADNVGTHTLQCVVPCEGHELLKTGRVRVVPPGAGVAELEPETTGIKVAAVPPSTQGEGAEVRALLTTAGGSPLEGMLVEFAVRTTFMMSDWMEVGRARTDAGGEAVLRFEPNRGGNQTVRASYAGSSRYVGSEGMMSLAVPEMALAYHQANRPLIPGLGFWLLWLVIGGIWLTYALVVLQLRQLSLDR